MEKISLAERDLCTGCGVCAAVCANRSIDMQTDAEGFAFPKIKDSCIGCGKCVRTCPILHKPSIETADQSACIAIHNNTIVWQESSSGGAFSAICELFGNEQTVIFGARFDSAQQCVHHDYVIGVSNIGAFRGSKYVQSDLRDCLNKVISFLRDGKKVIFSGTPCQIAALRALLGTTNTDNLLCIDLICHGVGSPMVFSDYLHSLSSKKKDNITDFNFRHKIIKQGVHQLYNTRTSYSDGQIVVDCKDPYIDLFLQKIICRRSCDHCAFSCTQRMGDLTIGDAKQMYDICLSIPFNRNASVIICNTEKGKTVFDSLPEQMSVYPCATEDVVRTNHPFSKCIQAPPAREDFFENYTTNENVILYMQKWKRTDSTPQLLKNLIPEKLKSLLRKVLG